MTLNVSDSSMSFINQLLSMKDPRTAEWVTMKDPKYITVIVLGYLYMAKLWGPRYMRKRKPYDLNRLIQCYNVFQVVANIYFCSRIAYLAYGKLNHSPFCQGLYYNTDLDSIALLEALYNYLLIRVIDFADTLFFVLKKKFSHVSQLHVIHHTIVVFSGWQFMQFGADGQTILGVALGCKADESPLG
ncbi:elongation of very long chain fatty acids protein 4-like [Tropilaelaps mercedesae]|uniref:Elongation of very long chain fatty acids protein n=1 Tax=Tropilaelaps mercedesae TaxID=418985 RepID=A0A1V9XW30_9ACAR|nr:elongation of very long chain fatty acids protein 4-like [Tropilaelaps mercedesae]